MDKRRVFRLSEHEQRELQKAERKSDDAQTRGRYQAVRLYGSGYSVTEVQTISGCSTRSLTHWCARYRDQGVAGLVDQRVGGNRAKLTAEQIEQVHTTLHRYTPDQKFGADNSVGGQFWTVADVRRLVKDDCTVVFDSVTSYRTLLDNCEMSYQKTQGVYKNRSAQTVAEFEEQLEKN